MSTVRLHAIQGALHGASLCVLLCASRCHLIIMASPCKRGAARECVRASVLAQLHGMSFYRFVPRAQLQSCLTVLVHQHTHTQAHTHKLANNALARTGAIICVMFAGASACVRLYVGSLCDYYRNDLRARCTHYGKC